MTKCVHRYRSEEIKYNVKTNLLNGLLSANKKGGPVLPLYIVDRYILCHSLSVTQSQVLTTQTRRRRGSRAFKTFICSLGRRMEFPLWAK